MLAALGGHIACLTLAAAAPSGDAEREVDAPRGPSFSVALDSVFSLHHGNFGTSSSFRFGVRPRPHIEFSTEVGVAHHQYAQQTGPAIAETRASNVVLGARWIQDDPGRRHHGYVGFSLVIPTHIGGRETQFEELLARDTIAARGGWNAWQWLPSTNAVVLPFGWRVNGRRGVFGLDGALAGLAHVRGDFGLAAQLRAYGGFAIRRTVLGLYATAAYNALAATWSTGSGAYVDTPLCKAGRNHCPLHLTATAGLGLTQTPTGLAGPTLTTGLGLRWGTPPKKGKTSSAGERD